MTPHAMWGMAFVRNTLPSSGLSKTTLQQNGRWLPHAYKSRCDECVIYTIVHPVHSHNQATGILTMIGDTSHYETGTKSFYDHA